MAAFYKLNDKYILRSWDKLPYAIVNDSTKALSNNAVKVMRFHPVRNICSI